ncbi:MAG TPA: formylmethanofuran--tetrahydromethanopterin N-formyltransferase, partial [Burkholderiales bacterium]
CPTLRGLPGSQVPEGVEAVLEIVIDGFTAADVAAAMRAGIQAAAAVGAAGGIRRISAGNYGGKLGQFHFKLHEVLGP